MLNLMYLIFLFFFICWFILNVPKRSGETPFDESFVRSFIKRYGGNSLSHLLFLQDKQIYMAQNDSVMISYRQKGNKFFVLGDPIGEELYFEAGLDEFIDYASRMRAIPVFYQASERFLPFLRERGYRFFKVGEEARVCLDHFKIEGKKSAKIRTTRNKFLREGYQFSVIYPPFSTELIEELKAVSDEWLAERYEKSFSVSSFQEDYITLFPVSILRSPQGKLVAFASLPSDYKADESISIDLMRYTKAGSSGAMDMVFLSTIMWAKEKGFSSCSLGMSPLSNVGTEEGAPIPEKIARYVFLNGCKYYNFKGLRRYKAKFATDWMPRYLVYKKSLLLILIIHLMAMVRKQPRLKRNSFVRKLIRVKKAV
ncbi:phosphatidylglycerol lysyltransferase domain-containing protein [Metabacillus sp. Hm71]|uniref:phosphatidylglycerol lysyltransferase domain-containing protein n=1 Tax=Metabacillus sp. Hm71 TaxID=3450743 RepID=UPI003F41EA2C